METKNSIRKQILKLRNALSKELQFQMSDAICKRVIELDSLQKAEFVLCYAGYKSEVLTDTLIQTLLTLGKKVYLPKVSGEEMDFYRIYSLDDLKNGYRDIPEPGEHCTERFLPERTSAAENEIFMFLPGCAFSEDGTRIGYGKGYYDRYLSKVFVKERIALAYDLQIVKDIKADEYDIPVTKIITEQRIIDIL